MLTIQVKLLKSQEALLVLVSYAVHLNNSLVSLFVLNVY